MAVKKSDIDRRWRAIRNNPDTELSLTPESIATFLRKKESKLVQEKGFLYRGIGR